MQSKPQHFTMNYKAIIPVFMLLATLAMVHAKPSPAWVYIMSNQAFKDAVREEETVQAHKEKADVQTGQASSLQELSNEQEDMKDLAAAADDCWWGPGNCHGSQWGK